MKPSLKLTSTLLATIFTCCIVYAYDRPLGIDPNVDGITNPHSELLKIGDKFSFGIIADSQVGHADANTGLYGHANYGLSQAIKELNERYPKIEFIIHLGDIVNVPDDPSLQNWRDRIMPFKGVHIVNHGNHDTSPPYTKFRDYQEQVNGTRSVYYSFDVGKWHFVTLPANIEFGNYDNLEVIEPMLEWLERDLETNKDRPTIMLVHLHFMPIGLSQLEWYSHSAKLKRRMLDIMTKWGNVKYYLNGHVHNGIKVTIKTAWTYKGITFLTMPTGTSPRPFGEEYEDFKDGLNRGGYYSVADVDGDKITFKSRLTGVDAEMVYPEKFNDFSEDIDKRCLTRGIDLPYLPKLLNGSFEFGLDHWFKPFRYNTDENPGFMNEWRMKYKRDGFNSAYVYAKPLGPHWIQDEYNENYQIIAAPIEGSPIFKGSYFIEEPGDSGGGFLRLIAVGGPENNGEFKFMMHFDYGEPKDQYFCDYYPRAMGYHISGKVSSWLYFVNIGKEKKGIYFNVPNEPLKWHDIQANIAQIYDDAVGEEGAYDKLGVNRFMVAAGVWCIKGVDIGSSAFFDAISLEGGCSETKSLIDGEQVKIDESVFKTEFGQWLQDQVIKKVPLKYKPFVK